MSKSIEKKRYNDKARLFLNRGNFYSENNLTLPIRTPYIFYNKVIKNCIKKNFRVLELGSGMGENTKILVDTQAQIFATDISVESLKVIKKRFSQKNINTKVADMESLPFENGSFDIVVSAGALSYGDNGKVMSEIYRVLNQNGCFIAIDSLNHNPIYKLNRFIHFLRGRRSYDTLKRMPTIQLIEEYGKKFGSLDVNYFGSLSFIIPLLNFFLNKYKIKAVIDGFDKLIKVRKSAFKFVMVASKNKNTMD